ncbi:hypothetical protein ACA910_001158 [Epithemia clementina (nom. ined.)]
MRVSASVFSLCFSALVLSVRVQAESGKGIVLHLPTLPKRGKAATSFPSSTPTSSPRGGADSATVAIASPQQGLRYALWIALNTGFVNGCCLSGLVASKKQGVSAVTGAWTNSAVGLAQATLGSKAGMTVFQEQLSVLVSYMAGSAIYGLLNPNPTAWQLVRSSSGWALLLAAGLLWLASTLTTSADGPMTTLCLAAVACGIQNSLTSSHSGNLLRTTHYSGMSSDIGTFGGQLLRGNKANAFKFSAFWQLGAAFWIGGFASIYLGQGQSAQTKLAASAVVPFLAGMAILFVLPSNPKK